MSGTWSGLVSASGAKRRTIDAMIFLSKEHELEASSIEQFELGLDLGLELAL